MMMSVDRDDEKRQPFPLVPVDDEPGWTSRKHADEEDRWLEEVTHDPEEPATARAGDVVRLPDGRLGKVVMVAWLGTVWEAYCDTDRGMECYDDAGLIVLVDEESKAAAAGLRGPLPQ
jgi:hypothetical protein